MINSLGIILYNEKFTNYNSCIVTAKYLLKRIYVVLCFGTYMTTQILKKKAPWLLEQNLLAPEHMEHRG